MKYSCNIAWYHNQVAFSAKENPIEVLYVQVPDYFFGKHIMLHPYFDTFMLSRHPNPSQSVAASVCTSMVDCAAKFLLHFESIVVGVAVCMNF